MNGLIWDLQKREYRKKVKVDKDKTDVGHE